MRSILAGVASVALLLGTATAAHALSVARFETATGLWSNPANWTSNPLFPNNGNGGDTWDVRVGRLTGATATLDLDVVVDRLAFQSGGQITAAGTPHTIQVNNVLSQVTTSQPNLRGGVVLDLQAGATASTVTGIQLDSSSFLNSSTLSAGVSMGGNSPFVHNRAGGTWNLNAHVTNLVGSTNRLFQNDGLLNIIGPSRVINADLINGGTLQIGSGVSLSVNNGSFEQTGGVLKLDGVLTAGPLIEATGGRIEGTGQVNSAINAIDTTFAPAGAGQTGILDLAMLTLGAGSELEFEVGGATPGTGHDQIIFDSGPPTVDGVLTIVFLNDFEDTWTTGQLVLGTPSGHYSGTFDNVAPGGALLDPNGVPFYVGYGDVISGLVITRTSFSTPVDEPAWLGAGAVLAALLLARRRAA